MFWMPNQPSQEIYSDIAKILAKFCHFTLKNNLINLKVVKKLSLCNNVLSINICMPFAWTSGFNELKKFCAKNLLELNGIEKICWKISYQIATLQRAKKQVGIKGVKNIIAISSGKGGVGKSSTAVNLAVALNQEGGKVGILDADIYGPSIPIMLGTTSKKPLSSDGIHMKPITKFGLATNSIGYLAKNNAIIWRGPMASKVLVKILRETEWPDVDYLIIDMPPGTGDIQLTLAQTIPVTGAIIITTPQNVALTDVKRGILMFEKVSIPIIGIIENMSTYICKKCGHQEFIFGNKGVKEIIKGKSITLLEQIPLSTTLRKDSDLGIPTTIRNPESIYAKLYRKIASELASQLYWSNKVVPEEISFRKC